MNSIISMREGGAGKEVFMRISTRGKNAIRLKDIAKRQNISEKYLEQIVAVLHKAALVKSIRGR